MDAGDIAREIHRRRSMVVRDGEKSQAMAEATIYLAYDRQPTLNDFTQDMCLRLVDDAGHNVTVVGSERIAIRVPREHAERFDVIIFARGRGFNHNEILGWLPSNRVRQAPKVKVSMDDFVYEVTEEFVFPMPEEFRFEEPDVNVPRIWNYEHGGWYLPTTGTYLYSVKGAELVTATDEKLASRGNKVR